MPHIYEHITDRKVYDTILRDEQYLSGKFLSFLQNKSIDDNSFLVDFTEDIYTEKNGHYKETIGTIQFNTNGDIEDNDRYESVQIIQTVHDSGIQTQDITIQDQDKNQTFKTKIFNQHRVNYPNVDYLVGYLIGELCNEEKAEITEFVIKSFLDLLGEYAIYRYNDDSQLESTDVKKLFIYDEKPVIEDNR